MNLWNIKNLPMPPINTYKALDTNIDIKHLGKVFQEGKNFFQDDKYMRAEYAVMSRIVYRMKQKFRSAKDFKALEKVHKALDNYFKTNIVSDLKCFITLIPSKYTDETYLPNKNILDYMLVRLQGLVKLMERIVETCKITAYLFERRMHTGHFWKIGLIIFSIVSRIYVLAKHTAKFICDFYRKALPFSNQLTNNGRNWLPENYILPKDLQQWMNVDWMDIDDELQIIDVSELPKITQFFDLVDDDDDDDIQFCEEYIMIDNEEDGIKLTNEFRNLGNINKKNIHMLRGFDVDEDIGEVIEINDSLFVNENDGEKVSSLNNNENAQNITSSVNNVPHVEENYMPDYGEVIESGDSFQNEKRQKINESEIFVLEDSSLSDSTDKVEVIELSSNSVDSELEEVDYTTINLTDSPLLGFNNKFLKTPISTENDERMLKSHTLRGEKKKKMMKKKQNKNNGKKLLGKSTFCRDIPERKSSPVIKSNKNNSENNKKLKKKFKTQKIGNTTQLNKLSQGTEFQMASELNKNKADRLQFKNKKRNKIINDNNPNGNSVVSNIKEKHRLGEEHRKMGEKKIDNKNKNTNIVVSDIKEIKSVQTGNLPNSSQKRKIGNNIKKKHVTPTKSKKKKSKTPNATLISNQINSLNIVNKIHYSTKDLKLKNNSNRK